MQTSIEKAIHLKSTLDTFRPLDAETETRIMQKFRLDWNYHSNNIEGNSLTYGETKALILHGITAQGKPLKDHFEITGHNEAIDWVIDILKDARPMTENFIKQFHTILLKEPYEVAAITPDGKPTKKLIKVGEYKSTPNHVKTKTGEIFRFATPEETPAKMHDLMEWFREKEGKISPIILAAEFHYRFIRIHPFDDGNGRVARLLMNFILMKNDFPPVIIKTDNKENYFSALQQADGGSIEAFIKFITENLVHSLELMILGAKGEDIEDPDDVLKELKLIEKQIDQIASNEEREIKLSERVYENAVKESLIPLFEEIASNLEKVADLFDKESGILTLSNYNKDGGLIDAKRFNGFNLASGFLGVNTDKLNEFGCKFILNNFKKIKESNDEVTSEIHLSFEEYNFKITTMNSLKYDPVFLIVPYGSKISEQQIKEISDAILKDFVNKISKKMKDFS